MHVLRVYGPVGALVGSLDNGATWFMIGSRTTIQGPGTLWLTLNDCPSEGCYTDNAGECAFQQSTLSRNKNNTNKCRNAYHM